MNITFHDVDFEFEYKTSEAPGPSPEDSSITGEFNSTAKANMALANINGWGKLLLRLFYFRQTRRATAGGPTAQVHKSNVPTLDM